MTEKGKCNICGGSEFLPGPGGRNSVSGKPPRCADCDSLERHRIVRAALDKMRMDDWKHGVAIQFSPDNSVDPDWFGRFEVSSYPGPNAIDICNIDRFDDAFDFVFVNHVLEHVPDDVRALKELLRVTSDLGMLLVTVPSPFNVSVTRDWGYPDMDQHGHYRYYGRDAISLFANIDSTVTLLELVTADPVTDDRDVIFVYTRNENLKRHILAREWIQKRSLHTERPLVCRQDVDAAVKRARGSNRHQEDEKLDGRRLAHLINHLSDVAQDAASVLNISESDDLERALPSFHHAPDVVTITVRDVDSWASGPDRSGFDVVVLSDVLDKVHGDPAHVIQQCNTCLKAGGHLILTTPNIARHLVIAELIAGNAPMFEDPPDGKPYGPGRFAYAPYQAAALVAAGGFEVIFYTCDVDSESDRQNKIVEWVGKNLVDDFTLHRDTIVIIARKVRESAPTLGKWPIPRCKLPGVAGDPGLTSPIDGIRFARTVYEARNMLRDWKV